MSQRPRLGELDGLRGLFALAVVVYHVAWRYPRYMLGLDMDIAVGGVHGLTFQQIGIVPVLCFFMISGFVIAWTVDRSRTPMDFVVSRVSRLFPAFWAAVAISTALMLLWPLPYTVVTLPQVLAHLTMLQELLGFPNLDGVYWSLTIELIFYGWALAILSAGQWRHVHLITLAWATLGLVYAMLAAGLYEVPWKLRRALLLDYAPFFCVGMALYRIWRGDRVLWAVATLVVAGLSMTFRLAPIPLAVCVLGAAAIHAGARGWLKPLAWSGLVWLGGISYSLYVSHQLVAYVVIQAMDQAGAPHGVAMAAAVAVALAVAWAIARGVERPAMRVIRTAYARWKAGRGAGGGSVVSASGTGGG